MGIITRAYSFGMDQCLVCNKKMRSNRKYKDYCTIKCRKKAPQNFHKLIDKAIKRL